MISRTILASLAAAALTAPAVAQSADLSARAVATSLGLERAELVQVVLAGVPGEATTVRFEFEGVDQRLDLVPSSVRSDQFRLIEQREGGYVDVPAATPMTYRGEAPTMPGGLVAASWLDDGLHARILMPDGESLWLEPLEGRVGGAGYADYAVYRDADVRDDGHTCGVGPDDPHRTAHGSAQAESGSLGGTPLVPFMGGFKVAEIGIDTDFQYFQDYGSTNATQNQIESVINSMNLQYESEVGITHSITTIIVRTTSNDPYTTSDASAFLNQFRTHWQQQQQSVQRDVAHLFTGKNLSGPTVGIAYLSAVCSSFGYGIVQSDCCGSFASKTDLSAHELGHNWSANHCSCSSFTMNASLTASNKFSPTATIPEIVNFSNQIGCLEVGPGGGGSGFACSTEAYGAGASAANIGNLFSLVDPEIGTDWPVSFSGFNGVASGLVIASASQSSLPFGDGTILVDYTNPTATVPVTSFFGTGAAVLPIPDNQGLLGATAYVQVGIVDPTFAGGYAFSNGLAVTFCD